MKKLIGSIAIMGVISIASAQKINYSIVGNDPSWDGIPNLYITPVLTMDVPWSNDGTNASHLGWGVRSHAVIKGRFFADVVYTSSLWNIISTVDTKPRQLELGGAMLLRSAVSAKPTDVVLSTREFMNSSAKNMEEVTYVTVPDGQEMKFAGVRGGLYAFRSIFEYSVPGEPIPGFNYNVPDEEVRGWTNAVGLYAGWTTGRVNNVKISSNNRIYSETKYNRWYADVLIAGYKNNFIENYSTNDVNPIPVGFRLGFETTNKLEGFTGKIIQAEVGYRPGFNGFYTSFGFSFLQLRKQLPALQ